jgi:RNA polymerase sigma factor (sigma-70 family)
VTHIEPLPALTLAELEAEYRRRFRSFVAAASAIVGDQEEAFDLVQDAFAAAVRARGRFRGGRLDAWLWRILLNKARDSQRSAARRVAASADPVPELAQNGAQPGDPDIRMQLARLPERQRLAIFLRYYADLDYSGIAAVLGVTPGTVAATLHAAHAFLRRELTEVAE